MHILRKQKSIQAFTLIETLIALTVITITIMGPLSVAITTSSYSKNTKDVITANYLAHEGVELVRLKRDSVYLECENDTATCPPISFAAANMENLSQTAWRTFKERMRDSVNPTYGLQLSCFTDDNPDGCSFDVLGMVQTGSQTGQRLSSLDTGCSSLFVDNRLDQTTYNPSGVGVTDRVYLCANTGLALGYADSGFRRVIKLTSVSPQYASSFQRTYEDDVRVESTVTYTRGLGVQSITRAIDYLHARP
jgi:Tfp pilus assembly protein PilV